MKILITQWALDSYLDLYGKKVFSKQEYQTIIRPDVLLLNNFPNNTKFSNTKFWSPANGTNITNGYKMKWHQIGNGKVQLRLTVGIISGDVYLCEAYVKIDDKTDKRKLAKFKVYLELIRKKQFVIRGVL